MRCCSGLEFVFWVFRGLDLGLGLAFSGLLRILGWLWVRILVGFSVLVWFVGLVGFEFGGFGCMFLISDWLTAALILCFLVRRGSLVWLGFVFLFAMVGVLWGVICVVCVVAGCLGVLGFVGFVCLGLGYVGCLLRARLLFVWVLVLELIWVVGVVFFGLCMVEFGGFW